MTITELDRLNRIFADARGMNEYGQPIYRWWRSTRLKFPIRSEDKWMERNGILVLETQYEWVPQIDDDCWVVAQWRRDDPREWANAFGEEVPHPQHGLYYVTSLMLKPGEEPCERVTAFFASCIAKQSVMSYRDLRAEILDRREEQKEAAADMISDWVDNAVPAFAHGEPGK